MRYREISIVILIAACGGGGEGDDGGTVDGPPPGIDASDGCEEASVLPTQFRPIAEVSTGMVDVAATGGVTSGTIDATAGGFTMYADNPYIYVDLSGDMKVAIDDIAALNSNAWDVALKRASIRSNGGDSGNGGRRIAVVQAATLADVTAAPTSGYTTDDFTTDDCMLIDHPSGEPMTAFGMWYSYTDGSHTVTPNAEVYVVERPDGTHTALRIETYYGDSGDPTRGAYYQVEWKDL